MPREEIRITNTVKVRPTRISPKGTVSNRPPDKKELSFFIPLLHEEIVEASPRLLVTLGNTPLKALLGKDAAIGDLHGQLTNCVIGGAVFRLFPLYHPAAIIYNRALKETYDQDVLALAEVVRKDREA